jgi:dolichyl-phosphate beta-glucosyltransferase
MNRIAIVIPCYNEKNRLDIPRLSDFCVQHKNITLCFVDDGSNDGTGGLILPLVQKFKTRVFLKTIEGNSGKAIAVREGILAMYRHDSFDIIGFLDADLAAPPEEFIRLSHEFNKNRNLQVILGSRQKLNNSSEKKPYKTALFSFLFGLIVSVLLRTRYYDTQCGIKLFKREIILLLFEKPMVSKWIFDVELLFRIKRNKGRRGLNILVKEIGLQEYDHKPDSRIPFSKKIRFPVELTKILLSDK